MQFSLTITNLYSTGSWLRQTLFNAMQFALHNYFYPLLAINIKTEIYEIIGVMKCLIKLYIEFNIRISDSNYF